MDEKRTKILVRSLRTTGRLFNSVGDQFWHEKREETRKEQIRW